MELQRMAIFPRPDCHSPYSSSQQTNTEFGCYVHTFNTSIDWHYSGLQAISPLTIWCESIQLCTNFFLHPGLFAPAHSGYNFTGALKWENIALKKLFCQSTKHFTN